MKRARGTKGLALLASALATSAILVGSTAGANSSAGALARSAAVPDHNIPLSAARGIAKPRSLDVPAKGSYGFLLKLDTEPTGLAYDVGLSRGLSAARDAAH